MQLADCVSLPNCNKLGKCRSLQTLQFKQKSAPHPPVVSTRPKFESIRPKYATNQNDSQQSSSEDVFQPKLDRIRSVDNFSRVRETMAFENIVELYKKENENLRQQNKYLVKEINKRQKNEEVLTNYISQLRKQIKVMERNRKSQSPVTGLGPLTPRSSSKQASWQASSSKVSKQSTDRNMLPESVAALKRTIIMEQGDTLNTMNEIQELNEKFNILMQQCSKETNRRNRDLIRAKMAETAEKMRSFRRDLE